MNRPLLVNVPVAVAVAFFIWAGQYGLFRIFGFLPSGEFTVLFLCVVAQTMVLTSAIVLLAGAFTRKWPSAIAWTIALTASTLIVWDNLSYRWVGLHLDETIPLLYWSMITTFRAVERKQSAVLTGLGGIAAGGIVLALLFAKFHGSRFYRSVERGPILKIGITALVVLAILEVTIPGTLSDITRDRRRRILPLLPLLLPPRPSLLTRRKKYDLEMPTPEQAETALERVRPIKDRALPDIYLFVFESFRGDHVVPEVTPNLARFGAEGVGKAKGIAASNCTHVSWYSLFHSRLPVFWSAIAHQPDHPFQSVPLAALKRAGYEIRVLATPNMNYYAIGDTLFRPGRSLASEVRDQTAHLQEGLDTIAELDRRVMNDTLATLHRTGPPAVYLVFLDSTHHDYVWGDEFDPPFKPYLPFTSLLKVRLEADRIGLLRNRYKNAAYVDSLMGEFFRKRNKSKRASLVAITGDHGEELYETGHVTHASELNSYQLEVPIFFSLPGQEMAGKLPPVISHLDIFPTLLDAIGIYQPVASVLDGQSLLHPDDDGVAVSAQCSNYTPYRYVIDSGQQRATLEFKSIVKMGRKVVARNPAITHYFGAGSPGLEIPLPLDERLKKGVSKLSPGWDQAFSEAH